MHEGAPKKAERTLEEMSREELITRVKELEAKIGQHEAERARELETFGKLRVSVLKELYEDALTEVANRKALQPAIDRLLANMEAENLRSPERLGKAAVIVCDIDHFKQINDTYGHGVGDEALKATAFALRSALRAGDEVFRTGGEEFMILCPNTDQKGAELAADRLRTAVERVEVPVEGRDTPLSFTMSFGVAEIEGTTSEDADGAIEKADQALYIAKEEGRNTVRAASDLFDPPPST